MGKNIVGDNGMKIRIIEADKIHAHLIADFEKHLSISSSQKYLAPFYMENYKIFLLEVNGEIIGKVDLELPRKMHQVAYLRRLVINPTMRRRGYGSELVQYCINYAKKNGMKFLDIYVHEDNKAAINLYEEMGFSIKHKEVHLRKELK
jgi:ribosomal protein S18 acetylase RimI-like enzyme